MTGWGQAVKWVCITVMVLAALFFADTQRWRDLAGLGSQALRSIPAITE